MNGLWDCRTYRRFGVEIEVNTTNGIVRRPDAELGEIPLGADIVARIVQRASGEVVSVRAWDHVHNNSEWIIKPDNSCGIEVNTPILKGWRGLERMLRVIDALRDGGIVADHRCSFHVHINIADLSEEQLASVIAWYIKCEPVFFDAIPHYRKNSRYCQLIGMTDLFDVDFSMDTHELIHRVSATKYCSLNAYHFVSGGGFSPNNTRKRTLEFRIADNNVCLDSFAAKNWTRLFLHFVEVTKDRPLPPCYQVGNRWSSLLWLDPMDVFSVLRFNEESSKGLQQLRSWFVSRLMTYSIGTSAIFSQKGRGLAREQIFGMSLNKDLISGGDYVYGKQYVI